MAVPPAPVPGGGPDRASDAEDDSYSSQAFKVRRIRGAGSFWVAETSISYDGGPWQFGCSMLEFRGDRVTRETIYIAEGWEAPAWRAPWRSPWVSEESGS